MGRVLGSNQRRKEGEEREDADHPKAKSSQRIAADIVNHAQAIESYCRILGLATEYSKSVKKFTAK